MKLNKRRQPMGNANAPSKDINKALPDKTANTIKTALQLILQLFILMPIWKGIRRHYAYVDKDVRIDLLREDQGIRVLSV